MDSNFSEERMRLFHDGCNENILEYIQSFVEQGYPVNSHADSSFGSSFTGFTPLHFAVQNQNKEAVIYLLKNGADIIEKSANSWTPVHLAYYCSATDLIFTIFEHAQIHAYVNAVDNTGLTHLHICCALNVPVIEQLITNGADVNCSVSLLAEKNCGFTPLHFAIQNGHSSTVRLLFEYYANPNITCEGGLTPLHMASERSDSSTAELLLTLGADPEMKDNKGRTALYCAAEHRSLSIVKLLIQNGASMHEPNNENETPFNLAVKNRHYEIVDAIISHCKRENTMPITFPDLFNADGFYDACRQGNLNAVKTFLKRGFSVNCHIGSNYEKEFFGYTPLHFAVQNANVDIIIYLLQNGADITLQSGNGWTPVHQAYYTSSANLISTIFEHSRINTYVTAADNTGLTHFHICCTLNDPGIVEDFIMSGADINCSTLLLSGSDSGFTPLHFAIKNKNLTIARVLLENGADHSLRSEEGLTPLHLACELDAMDSVELLLKFGADLMARDYKCRLPLHCIFYRDPKSSLVDFFFKKMPIEYNYADSQHLSLLHMACLRQNEAIVTRLLDLGCCPNIPIIMTNKSGNKTMLLNRWNLDGLTPLHMALYVTNAKIVEELLSAGADINAEDNNGYSPVSYIYNPSFSQPDVKLSGYILEIDMLIANHIKKLDTAGLYVSDKVYQEFLARKISGPRPNRIIESLIDGRMCRNELKKLQRIKIKHCADQILLSILLKSEIEMSWLVKDENVTSSLNLEYLNNLSKEFPIYGCMIKAQMNKGFRKLVKLQSAKNSLKRLTGFLIPDLCSEKIFNYLTNENLESLIDANIVS